MKVAELRSGFYVSEEKGLVRKVWMEKGDDLYWQSYELSTGEATGDSLVCSRRRMASWATREASAEEIARIRKHEGEEKPLGV